MTNLEGVLAWIVNGGGAAILAYWLMEHIKSLAIMAPEPKRYASLGLAGFLAVLATLMGILVGYLTAPSTPVAWVELIFSTIAVVVVGSQAIHARKQLNPVALAMKRESVCCCSTESLPHP